MSFTYEDRPKIHNRMLEAIEGLTEEEVREWAANTPKFDEGEVEACHTMKCPLAWVLIEKLADLFEEFPGSGLYIEMTYVAFVPEKYGRWADGVQVDLPPIWQDFILDVDWRGDIVPLERHHVLEAIGG